jgi:hypothetical protein
VTGVLRGGLALLAVAVWMVGIWNQFFPEHFYESFPGVALTPPYAEHYARDYGGATLGTAIVLTAAALVPRSVLVIPALLGMAAFAIPHAWFHLHHVEDADPGTAAVVLLLTIGQPVVTVALLGIAFVRWRRERASRPTM